jgi:REP element-mobilizing transposase RayT
MSENRYPQRKSPRLRGYDYSQSGAYSVTICTYKWAHLFGYITDGMMALHPIGRVAADCWAAIPNHFDAVELDLAVVMPNHVHGIIVLAGGGAALGTITGSYKAAVTRIARRRFSAPKTIWHTRYYDHIIRNEGALDHIRKYIASNPARWQADRLYSM